MRTQLLRKSIPELYMLLGILFYWVSTGTLLNPFAIVLLILIGWQLYAQKATTGIAIATIFLLLNLYMVLALISELSEFTTATSNFYELLIVGTLFLGANILASIFMFMKYLKIQSIGAA